MSQLFLIVTMPMNDLKTVKKSVRPQKCGLVPCDDAMICWPGSFRSPDPLPSSWLSRLQCASNKAAVHGAMSCLCIATPSAPRSLDGPNTLSNAGHSPVILRDLHAPHASAPGTWPWNLAPWNLPPVPQVFVLRFTISIRGLSGRAGLHRQPVSG